MESKGLQGQAQTGEKVQWASLSLVQWEAGLSESELSHLLPLEGRVHSGPCSFSPANHPVSWGTGSSSPPSLSVLFLLYCPVALHMLYVHQYLLWSKLECIKWLHVLWTCTIRRGAYRLSHWIALPLGCLLSPVCICPCNLKRERPLRPHGKGQPRWGEPQNHLHQGARHEWSHLGPSRAHRPASAVILVQTT